MPDEATITDYRLSPEGWEAFASILRPQVETFVENYYGERCPNKGEWCACCRAWAAFDVLFADN